MGVSTALLLALCIRGSVSFQPPSSLIAISSRQLHQLSTPTRPLHKLFAASNDGDTKKKEEDCDCSNETTDDDGGPDILQPYLPAMDPTYSARGPVGEGKFTISRSGPPTSDELSNEQMLSIIKIESTDLEVNTLVWKCLGYRFDEDSESWSPTEVFPKWKERFPDPPDFVGMKRVYSREVDQASLRANQALVRSVPVDNKQSLKVALKPLGWKGYQVRVADIFKFH